MTLTFLTRPYESAWADPMEPLPNIAILTSEFVDVGQLVVISLLEPHQYQLASVLQ